MLHWTSQLKPVKAHILGHSEHT